MYLKSSDTQLNRLLKSRNIVFVCLLWISSYCPLAISIDLPPACRGGICPVIGNAYFFPGLTDVNNPRGGYTIFNNDALTTCTNTATSATAARKFTNYNNMQELLANFSSSTKLGGSLYELSYSLGGEITGQFNQSSTNTSNFMATVLDITSITNEVWLQKDSNCWAVGSLDSSSNGFLGTFLSLPVNFSDLQPKATGRDSFWIAYTRLLKNFGSHIATHGYIGSRFQQWESTASQTGITIQQLQAKACADAEGPLGTGWSVNSCQGFDTATKNQATTLNATSTKVIQGGTDITRQALLMNASAETLNAFIGASTLGAGFVDFEYTPIWTILQEIYSVPCSQQGTGSVACDNFQRAIMLQAAYEGYLTHSCDLNTDSRGAVIQAMTVGAPDQFGIRYFSCTQAKTGCRAKSDCQLDGFGLDCQCEGPGCVDAATIPLTNKTRNFIRSQAQGWSNAGVNRSCDLYLFHGCECNIGWEDQNRERPIYKQGVNDNSSISNIAQLLGTTVAKLSPKINEDSLPTASVHESTVLDSSYTINVRIQQILPKLNNDKKAKVGSVRDPSLSYSVKSTPAGIDCPGVCSFEFLTGTQVILTAYNNVEKHFERWGGDCAQDTRGTLHSCTKKSNILTINNVDENRYIESYFKGPW